MAFHTWPGFDRRVGESRMADLAETLNRLVSRSARPDWTLGRGRKSHCGWYHGLDPIRGRIN
jgi:hypothetical protein